MYKARIVITLKEIIPDREGESLLQSSEHLTLHDVKEVRTGRYVEMVIDSKNKLEAQRQVSQFIEDNLLNPVIERYEIQLDEIS
ncbi:phosphoribosylformylglycinamidine synthase subunit PurS [Heliorestis acidaminivorans]|uniref:Phosphoribosylformylglycinamidine synthase subunit PurS n=1 Tax=Heliorestis acidaminivorans TaxID=553427 RepID=A0A6I0F1R9_9FIRM|nr:phosphoribosylformylglycinamidine synthase subunit PurS [Heliorestis acidaminivorans]KAB2953258.1 phosphoribosylformylglycinamidine synthase subunit PurS [Heliorestis acidaminivorans]